MRVKTPFFHPSDKDPSLGTPASLRTEFSVARKANVDFAVFAERLRSCFVTKNTYSELPNNGDIGWYLARNRLRKRSLLGPLATGKCCSPLSERGRGRPRYSRPGGRRYSPMALAPAVSTFIFFGICCNLNYAQPDRASAAGLLSVGGTPVAGASRFSSGFWLSAASAASI